MAPMPPTPQRGEPATPGSAGSRSAHTLRKLCPEDKVRRFPAPPPPAAAPVWRARLAVPLLSGKATASER